MIVGDSRDRRGNRDLSVYNRVSIVAIADPKQNKTEHAWEMLRKRKGPLWERVGAGFRGKAAPV
jgi:hypothetical protein